MKLKIYSRLRIDKPAPLVKVKFTRPLVLRMKEIKINNLRYNLRSLTTDDMRCIKTQQIKTGKPTGLKDNKLKKYSKKRKLKFTEKFYPQKIVKKFRKSYTVFLN